MSQPVSVRSYGISPESVILDGDVLILPKQLRGTARVEVVKALAAAIKEMNVRMKAARALLAELRHAK